MLGQPYSMVSKTFENPKSFFVTDHAKKYYAKDTILIGYYGPNGPFEALYLFQNDTCYFQSSKLFCSSCAEITLDKKLSDRHFKFKQVDKTNFQSKKFPNIILRLKKEDIDPEACFEILIIDTDIRPQLN